MISLVYKKIFDRMEVELMCNSSLSRDMVRIAAWVPQFFPVLYL